ncbi:ABC transporter permease [Clostridium oryzae]|uniref:ABC-2 family transporter protein n=1 Tax=Clostridium oryzae TaxID=1450648 RepID=A0A1V4IWG1_9CLOT|nr:ABC transporter permease [Clostridium oryzae]OPJ64392.1 ABC-2 family transporter protein [Clostridium oryzae]
MRTRKDMVISALIIIPIVIAAALIFSGSKNSKFNVALVSDNHNNIQENNKCKIIVLNKKPQFSTLALGVYDFVVEKNKDGSYTAETALQDVFKRELVEKLFNDGKLFAKSSKAEGVRGIGASLLGLIVLFVIIEGTTLTVFYPDDITFKTLKRIFTSEVSEKAYIIAQFLFTFIGLYVPTFIAITVSKAFLRTDIGYSVYMIALLTAIITALSTAFALFMSSIMRDNIQIASCFIALIVSLMCGCFYKFSFNIKIIDFIRNLLPISSYMNIAESIERETSLLQYKLEVLNVAVWTIAMLIMGIYITHRRLKNGEFN